LLGRRRRGRATAARRAAVSLLAVAALFVSVLVSAIGVAAPKASAATCGTTNIALNKTATASSYENQTTFPASAAVDGNTGTRWSSAFSDPQWLEVDLGSSQSVCGVTLTWEAAYATAFQIQVSTDNTNWTSIYSTTTGTGGTQNLTGLSGTGRYIRMYGTVRATQYGYSLWEFQVFAASGGTGTGGVDISAGGPAAAPFVADTDFSGGTATSTAATVSTTGITNPAPQSVWQHNRYGNITYTIPGLTAGASYSVRLDFAETYWTAAGSRTFNVLINGTQVLTSFDIFATAGGGNKAVTESFTTNASSAGAVTIQFVTVKDNAQVNGIEVQPVGGGTNTVTVTSPGAETWTVGTAASLQIQASDSASGQTLTYSATGLPAGLSISSSGLISGTPTTAATSSVTVTARDSTGASGSATFSWTVSTSGGGGACHITYTKNSEWAGGFTVQVVIANTGTTAVNGWSLAFTFPGDQHITSNFNGGFSQTGENATLTNASYNGAIAAGGSVSVGFQGTWTSNDTNPTAFTLNGAACS
jgi:hypothetical protein